MSIRIITDSTAYLERDFAEANHITIVPLSIEFEGQSEVEGYPGEFDAFFQRLAKSTDFPTTSQPSVGAFQAVFEQGLEQGHELIVLTLSSKLSGTYNSAWTAASLVDAGRISVIDSLTAAANLRFLVELALDLIAEGKTRDEVVDKLNREKYKMGIRLTVGTLDYLKKGGRLSSGEAFLGSLLNIKPIIALVDGKLEPAGKVRGRKKAIEKLIEEIPATAARISIAQIDALDEAHEVKELLESRFPHALIDICELGPVVGAHLGPKALGLLFTWI